MVSTTAVTWLPNLQVSILNTILSFIFLRVMQPNRVVVETITDSCHTVYGTEVWNLKTIYRNSAYKLLGYGNFNVRIIRLFCQLSFLNLNLDIAWIIWHLKYHPFLF